MALTPAGTSAWSPAPAAASATTHASASEFVVAAFNSKRFAGYQGFGYIAACLG